MGNSIVQKLTMSGAKEKIGNLAQTNHYFVEMSGLKKELSDHFKNSYPNEFNDISRFIHRLGYLCSEASLPTSSYATAEVKDNFMGVTQEFAHTRIYTDLDLTFYVDAEYKVLRFFEGWMDYISGGNQPNLNEPAAGSDDRGNIYRRFNYPNFYKLSTLKLYKFERDYRYSLDYNFINAFPKSVSALPVSYGPAEVLKVTVTFNYDRYLVKKDYFLTDEDYEEAARKIWTQPLDIDLGIDYSIYNNFSNPFSGTIEPIPFLIDSPIKNTQGQLNNRNIPQGNFKSNQ